MIQNSRGLITENTKWKIEFLNEYAKNDTKILLMNFTETWLKENIKDEADIEGFKIFRGDRKGKKNGGTAIYLYEKLEADQLCELSHEKCEMVAINIHAIQTINIVVYRPPGTKLKEFNTILNKLQDLFKQLAKPNPTLILTGDFNFPFVKWKRLPNNSCSWEYKANTNATTDEKQQFEKLINLCNNQCMLQMIEEPTREENTLDLIFTNEINIATTIEVNKTKLSDHDCIEVSTNYIVMEQPESNETKELKCTLKSLNFRTEQLNWKEINKSIKEKPWREIFGTKDTIEGYKEFDKEISNICMEIVPRKQDGRKKRRIPKERQKLLNRIKMLKREKHKAYSKEKKNINEKKILETEVKLIELRRKEKLESEEKAIDSMKENPRMLFSYINKQRNRKNEIGPFKNGDEFIYDGKEICKELMSEFHSQFSEQSSRENENLFDDCDSDDLSDIEFGTKEIEEAINELNENSSAGPDGLPAIFLKKTKETISLPLALLLRKSLDEGKIPDILKLAYVTPIHKGGSRQKPEQYRPVSLTSHVMKVFERVIKK